MNTDQNGEEDSIVHEAARGPDLAESGEGVFAPRDPLGPNSPVTRNLRILYDTVCQEGIPDRFLDLLERLDAAEQAALHKTSAPNQSRPLRERHDG